MNIINFGIKEKQTTEKSTACIYTAFQNFPKLHIFQEKMFM